MSLDLPPTRHAVRAKIRGLVMHDRDLLYVVTAPNFVGGFTVYNGEITGVSQEVEALWNGTAHWALQECARLGWQVEKVEDRR